MFLTSSFQINCRYWKLSKVSEVIKNYRLILCKLFYLATVNECCTCRQYQVKILHSEVITACTRTPVKVLNHSQRNPTYPRTRSVNSDTSEIIPRTSWGSTQISGINPIHKHWTGTWSCQKQSCSSNPPNPGHVNSLMQGKLQLRANYFTFSLIQQATDWFSHTWTAAHRQRDLTQGHTYHWHPEFQETIRFNLWEVELSTVSQQTCMTYLSLLDKWA